MRELYVVQAYREVCEAKGYAFFDSGDHNVNLIGIRSDEDKAGEFDDHLAMIYKVAGRWQCHFWPATTDPGARLLRHPINAKGAAILVPNQYRGAYQIGNHRGYSAIVQRGKVQVYRDRNKDNVLDWYGETDGGYFGINIHRAMSTGVTGDVAGFSAGCQVFQSREDFDRCMTLAGRCAAAWGNSFTYTLVRRSDFAA